MFLFKAAFHQRNQALFYSSQVCRWEISQLIETWKKFVSEKFYRETKEELNRQNVDQVRDQVSEGQGPRLPPQTTLDPGKVKIIEI